MTFGNLGKLQPKNLLVTCSRNLNICISEQEYSFENIVSFKILFMLFVLLPFPIVLRIYIQIILIFRF